MPKTISIDLTNLPDVTNEAYMPLYNDPSRYLVLMGGGSSGKSVYAAQKTIYRMLDEKGHRCLALRKVARTLRESVFAELRNVIHGWGFTELFTIPKGASGDLYIRCINGNEILFAGLDDVEKLKSIVNITSIWIEEASEIAIEDFRQLDIRMRGKSRNYKQMLLTFNPVSITHWLKDEFFGEVPKLDSRTLKTTYRDNRFLDQASIDVLEGFKDTDPYYYMVYCMAAWGITGQTVFNAEAVTARLMQVRDEPVTRGSFIYKYKNEKIVDSSIRFIEDGSGPVAVYERPADFTPYVIGGDIAEGGVDYSAGIVRNNITWNQAAVWHGHVDTDLYAKQMYCLGKYYNDALIGIETNFDLHPVKELERLGYHRQYRREAVDDISNQRQHKHGFLTTRVTRPVIISKYVAMARDHIENWNDVITLEEMLTFVRDEEGKPAAQGGKHDDCILADAIALEIRDQQSLELEDDGELHFPDYMTAEEKAAVRKNLQFEEHYAGIREKAARAARRNRLAMRRRQ